MDASYMPTNVSLFTVQTHISQSGCPSIIGAQINEFRSATLQLVHATISVSFLENIMLCKKRFKFHYSVCFRLILKWI